MTTKQRINIYQGIAIAKTGFRSTDQGAARIAAGEYGSESITLLGYAHKASNDALRASYEGGAVRLARASARAAYLSIGRGL